MDYKYLFLEIISFVIGILYLLDLKKKTKQRIHKKHEFIRCFNEIPRFCSRLWVCYNWCYYGLQRII